MVGEAPESVDGRERVAQADAAEFRKEIEAEYGPEGVGEGFPDWSKEKSGTGETSEGKTPAADGGHAASVDGPREETVERSSKGETPAKSGEERVSEDGDPSSQRADGADDIEALKDKEKAEGEEPPERTGDGDRVAEADAEDLRKEVAAEHGPDGLGESPDRPEEKDNPEHSQAQEQQPGDEPPDHPETLHHEQPGGEEKGRPEAAPAEGAESKPPADGPDASRESTKNDGQENRAKEAERAASPQPERPERQEPDPARKDGEPPLSDKPEVAATPREEVAESAVKIESFHLNDNQVVVTKHEGPGRSQPQPEVETRGLHHVPSEAQPEQGEKVKASGDVDEHPSAPQFETSNPTRCDVDSSERQGSGSDRVLATVAAQETPSDRGITRERNPSASEVGRYSRNAGYTMMTGPERAGERSERPEVEDVIRSAVEYMKSTALLVPEGEIPTHAEGDVIAVTVARETESWKEYTLYCKHTPGADKAYLDLRQLDAELHERFKIRNVEVHSADAFADGYNAQKPRGLVNTAIVTHEEKVLMKVDYREVTLTEARLRSQEGKAVLDAKLGNNDVKIASGVDGSVVRLRDHSLVTGMRAVDSGIILNYQRTDHDPYPHVRLISLPSEVGERRLESPRPHRFEMASEGCEVLRPISLKPDVIPLRISDQNRRKAWEYWASAPTRDERAYHQGDVGESVVETLLKKSSFRLIDKESLGIGRYPVRHYSERPGPDCVMERDGEYYIGQTKHWRSSQEGLKAAREDIEAFPSTWKSTIERKLDGRIKGGLAVQVDWSYRNTMGAIYTDYMEFR